MKEVKESRLNDTTGIQTILLPEDSAFLSVHHLGSIVLIYETEKVDYEVQNEEFTFHVVAGFDYIPTTAIYIGTVTFDDSFLHVYRER